jgi:uncharacterized protein (DUF305 family)
VRRIQIPFAIVFGCLLAGVAAGQSTTQGQSMTNDQHADSAGTKSPRPTPATSAYKDAARKMHIDMAVPYSGDADKDFAAVLVAHQKGAVELAKVELKYGTDPDLRKHAEEFIAAQEKEKAFLEAWQAKHQ